MVVVFDVNSAGENAGDNRSPEPLTVDDSTLNQAFGLLGNQRRRYALKTLHSTPETVISVSDLADSVLARDPDAIERERVLVGLQHKILPRLADEGVIDFNRETETIRYHGDELVDSLLGVLDEENSI